MKIKPEAQRPRAFQPEKAHRDKSLLISRLGANRDDEVLRGVRDDVVRAAAGKPCVIACQVGED